MSTHELKSKRCKPCEGNMSPLSVEEADVLLTQLDGWAQEERSINKTYSFSNYYETMAFVNAAAFVAHQEDHHPELIVGYKTCQVTYTTHSIGGLSENDFICAAKLDALLV